MPHGTLPTALEEDLIYDVGAHRGEDTAHYLRCGYRVVAVEANPYLANQLSQRFASDPVVVVNAGIGSRGGTATFWVNEANDEHSSFDREVGCRDGTPCHPVEIECVTFRSLLESHGVPFYLKIDIEGADGLCLNSLSPDDLPAYVSIEAHTADYVDRLSDLGYRDFKLVDQTRHSPRVLQRLGLARFPVGTSGRFGESTRGRWQSADRVVQAWRSAGTDAWYDFHAKL
jgi:FkbM family methyltransferase